ncbi:MAG: hypothetical protein ACO3T2_05280, partial [Burkholderiaceae bacterium]
MSPTRALFIGSPVLFGFSPPLRQVHAWLDAELGPGATVTVCPWYLAQADDLRPEQAQSLAT